jgi:hypothetical protein
MPVFNDPVINQIGYTSSRVTLPSVGDWPTDVTSADLYIRKDSDSYGAPFATGLAPSDIVIFDSLTEDTSYFIKISGVDSSEVLYESSEINFNTLVGEVGPGIQVDIPGDDVYPGKPAPVTIDNPGAFSAVCRHEEDLPDNSDSVILKYREFDSLGLTEWVDYLDNVISDVDILVSSLTEDSIYEFVFVAENSFGETWGDIARYQTNNSTDPGETKPASPILENRPYPDGKTIIRVNIPASVASITTYTLQYSTNPLGSWTNVPTPVNPLSVVDVTGFTLDTQYYFRVFNDSYVGSYSSIYTLPELSSVPGLVTFGDTGATFINAILPALPLNADYLKLQRGIGSSDNITWENTWAAFNSNESFFDTLLNPDTIYWYRAISVNESGEIVGPVSQSDTYTVIPDAPEPIIFQYVGATYSDLIIPEMPERATRMSLERGLDTLSDINEINDRISEDSVYRDSELTADKLYLYKLISHNSAGTAESCVVGIHTRLGNEISAVQAPDVNITAIDQVTIYSPTLENWPKNVNELILQYRDSLLIFGEGMFGQGLFGNALFGGSTETDWVTLVEDVYNDDTIIINNSTDTPLIAGHEYAFRWIAKNDYSSYPSSVTNISLTVPDEPNVPTLTPGVINMIITTPVNKPENSNSFSIQKLINSVWTTLTGATNLGVNVEFTDDTPALSPVTEYSYRVVATNFFGDTPSEEVSATTLSYGSGNTDLSDEPVAPVITTRNITSLVVEVPNPFPTKADVLNIKYRIINSEWQPVSRDIVRSETSFTISGLTDDTLYEIYWISKNINGEIRGDSTIVRTKPLAPGTPETPSVEVIDN